MRMWLYIRAIYDELTAICDYSRYGDGFIKLTNLVRMAEPEAHITSIPTEFHIWDISRFHRKRLGNTPFRREVCVVKSLDE
jgi:hypothetical protein